MSDSDEQSLLKEITNDHVKDLIDRIFAPCLEEGGEREYWEFHNITLSRVTGYGFGIAVSGGRDNPHFANGDPSIAISDVLKAGPAEGKLRINDRVISANGISLENVDYATAVKVLRECSTTVNLVIKRKVVLPPNNNGPQTLKVTLTKSKKKDDYGIVLGCWIYIKEITNRSLLEKHESIQEGDIITKVNNNNVEGVTLKEAKKLIENSKEKLHLVVRRESGRNTETQQPWSNRCVNETTVTLNKDSPSNFIDVSSSHPHWSNQNVYVQSPTRGDYKSGTEKIEHKNNLTRSQSNWNHHAIDNSINHSDLNNYLSNSHSSNGLEDMYSPPRPPLPQQEENARRDIYSDHALQRSSSPPDPRFISFQKDGSVGIRLTGGNEVGIFVTGVQHGTSAFLQGLQPGDKILKVNDIDMRGFTKEEAVALLVGIQEQVNLIVQHRKDEYEDVVNNQKGDSFYIRTHFSHESTGKGEVSFRKGEVFHVIDTLYNGNPGSWLVYRLGRNGQEIQRGVIPNSIRARELSQAQQTNSKKDEGESRGSFFRRRARRSKSLCKDHWEDVLLASTATRFPAYERVVLKQPGFIRPIVIFGPLTDIVRDRLLKDYPECYAAPQSDNQMEEEQNNLKSSGIIRLSAIRDVIDKGKHAILDITPNAVDRLNYAQFYPVVVFTHAENKHVIKELRAKWSKSTYKSSRKLYDHALKLEKLWSHIFTATISLTTGDSWYKKLQETIDRQQKQPLWVSEAKPDEAITDDFLFPMTSRLSYASSPESDLDLSIDSRSMTLKEFSSSTDRRLVKSSSDPSITAAEELAEAQNYNQYPSYSLGRNGQLLYPYYIFRRETAIPIQSMLKHPNDMMTVPAKVLPVDDQSYPPPLTTVTHNDFTPYQRSRIDPYATLTPSERLASLNGALKEMYDIAPKFKNTRPPLIDRSNKPLINYNQEIMADVNMNVQHDYINTLENFDTMSSSPGLPAYNGSHYNDTSRYNDNFHVSASNIPQFSNGMPQSSVQEQIMTSPLSSTFSNPMMPYQSMTLDRAKLSQAKLYRNRHDIKPPPPPPPVKSFKTRLADGRPVPPPKPVQFHGRQWHPPDRSPSDVGTRPMDQSKPSNLGQSEPPYHSRSYPTSPSKPPPPPKRKETTYYNRSGNHLYQENSTDTGHVESADRFHSYSQDNVYSTSSRAYSNVMFGEPPRNSSRSQPVSPHSPPLPLPPPMGLDLSSRGNRGSAFELYKKSEALNINEHHESSKDSQKRYILDSPNATHNVIAAAQGVFGSDGGTLTSKETGVTVLIPPGAISKGEQHEIYFKVCHDSNMLPPLDRDKGETLLSPLVMCGPHGLKFNVPIELRLPHCASITPDSWSFALKSSDTPSGEPAEWQNVSLDNKDGVTSSRVENDYVSVLVDHF